MRSLNFDDYLHSPERVELAETTMRLLFTFIGELTREEHLNYKTQLLLCRIAPSLCQLANESTEIFSNIEHPVRKIISSIVIISKSVGTGNNSDDYLYKSLKESIKALTARSIDGMACLKRVASDLEYIVKLSQIRSTKSVVTRIDKSASGRITQSKIKAVFFVVTEVTKFDCSDRVLSFVLSYWVELLTVTLIKFPVNKLIEKEVKRMTFLLLYLSSVSITEAMASTQNILKRNAQLLEQLLFKTEKLVQLLGDECVGHSINFNGLDIQVTALIEENIPVLIKAN